MTQLRDIVQFLDQTLDYTGFDDSSLNGLQVESSNNTILKVGYSVDAGLSVLKQAAHRKCQLLLTHHGLFWGQAERLNGLAGEKIRTLIESGCSLYTSHLPLDAHPSLGNNAQIVKLLGAELGQPFCKSGNKTIGYFGLYPHALKTDEFENRLIKLTGQHRFLGLKFGKSEIKDFAVVSGGGSFAISEASILGADAFITGEPKQSVFHIAKELSMNAFFAGHYATETFGVKAVAELLKDRFSIEVEFIDEPTSI
jgi:dinuclear metal center YbgI/SA1388 family protein